MPQQQKRTLEEAESFLEGVKVLLLDIEGTITPINFVKVNYFSSVSHVPGDAFYHGISSFVWACHPIFTMKFYNPYLKIYLCSLSYQLR